MLLPLVDFEMFPLDLEPVPAPASALDAKRHTGLQKRPFRYRPKKVPIDELERVPRIVQCTVRMSN